MENAGGLQQKSYSSSFDNVTVVFADLNAILLAMRGRHSSNPMDKVCAIALPFQKGGIFNIDNVTFPIYNSSMSVSAAWARLISSIASTAMRPDNELLETEDHKDNELNRVCQTITVQLLRFFPHPSRHHWFPSWTQVQQYPDVSIKDNDPVPIADDMDFSMRIQSGRIYRGCSLQIIQPPTSEKKAIYCCTMDGKDARLVATVPGVEPHINPGSKYVLVDISPDYSLWGSLPCLNAIKTIAANKRQVHEHPPRWPESIIIVCEEVDTLGHTAAHTIPVIKHSSKGMRYRLRRVTTLEWDCRPSSAGPGPGNWLPFKPSLTHLRSVLCIAMDKPGLKHFLELRV